MVENHYKTGISPQFPVTVIVMKFPLLTSRSKINAFKKGRMRMSDEDFLKKSGILPPARNRKIALTVRNAMENTGLIDPRFIFPDDKYPQTLGILPHRDSLDSLELYLETESELNVLLPDNFQPVKNM